MLIPEDSSANWWPGDDCSEIRRIVGYYNEKGKFCSGRIHFINAETGEEMKGNPKGSNLLIFIPGCKYHIGTKHVSKGELLAIGNLIISAEKLTDDDLLDCTEEEIQVVAA